MEFDPLALDELESDQSEPNQSESVSVEVVGVKSFGVWLSQLVVDVAISEGARREGESRGLALPLTCKNTSCLGSFFLDRKVPVH